MSKDKYSNDHTIKVVGDTQTLTVEDNLSVLSDVSVGGNATIGGDIAIGGDVTITGTIVGDLVLNSNLTANNLTVINDITVGGSLVVEEGISADSYSWESGPQEMHVDIPIIEICSGLGIAIFALVKAGTVVPGVSADCPTIICTSPAPRWDFVVPFDAYVRHWYNGKSNPLLKSVAVIMASGPGTLGAIECQIEQIIATGSTAIASIATDTQSFTATVARQKMEFDVGSIPILYNTLNRLRFTSISGNHAIVIYKITLIYLVNNVEEAINIIVPTT
jgi:hypothetical protein